MCTFNIIYREYYINCHNILTFTIINNNDILKLGNMYYNRREICKTPYYSMKGIQGKGGLILKRIIINNGFVIDPGNKVASKLNIAIEDGKITEISSKILDGDIIIDASGLIVTPGFVDCHMHEDPYNEEEDRFELSIFPCMLRMGVTTAIGGNCGIGPTDIPKYIARVSIRD